MKFIKEIVRSFKRRYYLEKMRIYSDKMLKSIHSEGEWFYWKMHHDYWADKFYSVM